MDDQENLSVALTPYMSAELRAAVADDDDARDLRRLFLPRGLLHAADTPLPGLAARRT